MSTNTDTRYPAGTCKNAVKINGAFKTPGRQAPYTIMNVCTPDHRRMAPLCYKQSKQECHPVSLSHSAQGTALAVASQPKAQITA